LPPASFSVGSGARPKSTPLISPRNQGPEKTIAAFPWLNSAVIRATDGSAGRKPCPSQLIRVSAAFTSGAELRVGLRPSNTPPPKPFMIAAW